MLAVFDEADTEIIALLRARLAASSETRGDCLAWTGAVRRGGYGQIALPHARFGKRGISAHRAAWIVAFGPIPDGLYVCHRCDNKACVNPSHLFLGTARDNAIDASYKGLLRRSIKTTSADRKSIIQLYRTGVFTHRELAEHFGVSPPTVRDILSGRTSTESE